MHGINLDDPRAETRQSSGDGRTGDHIRQVEDGDPLQPGCRARLRGRRMVWVSGGNRQSISLFALHIGRRSAVGIADRRRRTHEPRDRTGLNHGPEFRIFHVEE